MNVSASSQSTELTLQKANNLFFHSFFFSQGNGPLQEDIFHWIKANFPGLHIEISKENEYRAKLNTPAFNFLKMNQKFPESYRHQIINESSYRSGFENAFEKFIKIFTNNYALEPSEADRLIPEISKGICRRDYSFIVSSPDFSPNNFAWLF